MSVRPTSRTLGALLAACVAVGLAGCQQDNEEAFRQSAPASEPGEPSTYGSGIISGGPDAKKAPGGGGMGKGMAPKGAPAEKGEAAAGESEAPPATEAEAPAPAPSADAPATDAPAPEAGADEPKG